jgi:hypothetical protein
MPTVRRARDVAPGLAVIATEDGFRSLARSGAVGFPLLVGEGRIGSAARGRVVLR